MSLGDPCSLHKDRPGECPQAHICGNCGQALSDHISASMLCPTGGGSFSANAETRRRFPDQYTGPPPTRTEPYFHFDVNQPVEIELATRNNRRYKGVILSRRRTAGGFHEYRVQSGKRVFVVMERQIKAEEGQ